MSSLDPLPVVTIIFTLGRFISRVFEPFSERPPELFFTHFLPSRLTIFALIFALPLSISPWFFLLSFFSAHFPDPIDWLLPLWSWKESSWRAYKNQQRNLRIEIQSRHFTRKIKNCKSQTVLCEWESSISYGRKLP